MSLRRIWITKIFGMHSVLQPTKSLTIFYLFIAICLLWNKKFVCRIQFQLNLFYFLFLFAILNKFFMLFNVVTYVVEFSIRKHC